MIAAAAVGAALARWWRDGWRPNVAMSRAVHGPGGAVLVWTAAPHARGWSVVGGSSTPTGRMEQTGVTVARDLATVRAVVDAGTRAWLRGGGSFARVGEA